MFNAELTQTWYEKGCKAEGVDIAAGAPWAVAVGTTLTCGNSVKKAHLTVPLGAKSSTYRMNNTGRPPQLPGRVEVGIGAVGKADQDPPGLRHGRCHRKDRIQAHRRRRRRHDVPRLHEVASR